MMETKSASPHPLQSVSQLRKQLHHIEGSPRSEHFISQHHPDILHRTLYKNIFEEVSFCNIYKQASKNQFTL